LWRCGPKRAMASSFIRFRDHTQRRTTGVGLLWARDKLVPETSGWQHTTLTHPGEIRTHNLCRRAAAHPNRSPRGHWDRPSNFRVHLFYAKHIKSRSQWPRGLRRRSAAARLLRLCVRIPPGAWMAVCSECCVLTGRGLWVGLITRPVETYRKWCVVLWSRNLVNEEALVHWGAVAPKTKKQRT
jgi:hypothetical protein